MAVKTSLSTIRHGLLIGLAFISWVSLGTSGTLSDPPSIASARMQPSPAEHSAHQSSTARVSATLASDLSEDEDALLQWAFARGLSEESPLRPHLFEDTACRGMIATRDIEQGETVLSVPQTMLMSADTAVKCPAMQQVMDSAASLGIQLCERQLLSTHLLVERSKGPASFWASFIRSIPLRFDTLENWGSADIVRLQVPSLLRMAHKRCEVVKKEFRDLQSIMKSISEFAAGRSGTGEPLFGKYRGFWWKPNSRDCNSAFTFDDYRWAAGAVSTRSCHYAREAVIPLVGDSVGCLVPVMDFLNHSPEKVADCEFHTTELAYQVKVTRAYQRGEQVLIHYGDWNNAGLLEHYGFVIQKNPLESSALEVPDPGGVYANLHKMIQDSERSTKRRCSQGTRAGALSDVLAVLQSLAKKTVVYKEDGGEAPLYEVELYSSCPVEIPWNLLTMMRWKALEVTNGAVKLAPSVLEADEDSPISEENERAAKSELIRLLQRSLERLPTSIDEDITALNGSTQGSHEWIAIAMRKGQKELLRNVLDHLVLEQKKSLER